MPAMHESAWARPSRRSSRSPEELDGYIVVVAVDPVPGPKARTRGRASSKCFGLPDGFRARRRNLLSQAPTSRIASRPTCLSRPHGEPRDRGHSSWRAREDFRSYEKRDDRPVRRARRLRRRGMGGPLTQAATSPCTSTIADVSHYIRPGSAIDSRRQHSTRAPASTSRIVRCLCCSLELSTAICSLRSERGALVMSRCSEHSDHQGVVVTQHFYTRT
jgi:hypothetical protein